MQKPGRYTGGEPGSIYKEKDMVDVRFAFCFPDTYEVGMSFLGEKILYELLNSHENWWCERAFMPWLDMKAEMERLGLPLYTMESKDPLTAFDAVGFTLQYELSYTNILAMLDLAGIPFYSRDRDERWPLIISGGPCVCNAEPMADFFDVMQLGEGEQMLQDICAAVEQGKKLLIAVVCDGMGGARGGREASVSACDVIEHSFHEQYAQCLPGDEETFLKRALISANRFVFQKASREEELAGMGTTAVCALVRGGTVYLCHAGDSRAYLFRAGKLTQLTHDLSLIHI